jgi:hypothetical protein
LSVVSWLVQVTLNFEIPFSDTVSLIPVELYAMQPTIRKTDGCDPLQFAPISTTVGLSKKLANFDTRPCGNCFHILDCSDNFECHRLILCSVPSSWQVQLTAQRSAASRANILLRY